MKLLFDTHAFLWWDSEPELLPPPILDLCRDPNNQLLLSVVSAWEIQVKTQLGKLQLKRPLTVLIRDQRKVNHVRVLPVWLKHVILLQDMPLHHRDPFDRLLIAQSRVEGATLLSRDALFHEYGIDVVW